MPLYLLKLVWALTEVKFCNHTIFCKTSTRATWPTLLAVISKLVFVEPSWNHGITHHMHADTCAHSLSLFPYTVYMCVSSCISPCVQSPGQASSLSPQPAGSLHQPVSSLSRTMLACNPTLEANEMQHRQSALQHLLFVWAFFFWPEIILYLQPGSESKQSWFLKVEATKRHVLTCTSRLIVDFQVHVFVAEMVSSETALGGESKSMFWSENELYEWQMSIKNNCSDGYYWK